MSQVSSYKHLWQFSADQLQQLNQQLSNYVSETRSELAILTDESGQLISHIGEGSIQTIEILGNLAAAGFAASAEIDDYIGFSQNNHLKHLLLEGEQTNIYISNVAENLLLITAFSSPTTIATVQIYSGRAGQKIKALAQMAISDSNRAEKRIDLQIDKGFGAEIDRQLNILFGNDEKL